MLKIILTFLLVSIWSLTIGQNVNIPDANFKNFLVNDPAINWSGDNEISYAEASSVYFLEIYNQDISDFTWIEAFTSLFHFACDTNTATSLDLSANTNLGVLSCEYGELTSLVLPNTSSLIGLHCHENNLQSINLSGVIGLQILECSSNQLNSLDLSNNTNLEHITCRGNDLTDLDFSDNSILKSATCSNNQLSSLSVANNPSLYLLQCGNNLSLTSIELSGADSLETLNCVGSNLNSLDVSNNHLLEKLYCGGNSISTLDVSENPALIELNCSGNLLSELNVQNGNNLNITQFVSSNNANLECIQVDDPVYSTNNWTDVDSWSSFSDNCSVTVGVEPSLIESGISLFPNPSSGIISLSSDSNQILELSLINRVGQIVCHFPMESNSSTYKLDFSEYTKGIYFLKGHLSNGSGFLEKIVLID